MSLPRFSEQCEPSWESFLGGKTPEPMHDGCPGGSNTPGLIGGWTCPCECHVVTPSRTDRQPPTSATNAKGGLSAVAPETTKHPDLVTHHEAGGSS